MSGPVGATAAEWDPVRRVLVIAAMRRETAALRGLLFRRGRPGSADVSWSRECETWLLESSVAGASPAPSEVLEVVVGHCGVGPGAVRAWLEGRSWEQPPHDVAVVGFAGALDPALRPGAVVWPRVGAAVDAASGARTSPWNLATPGGADAGDSGPLWTVEQPMLGPAEKRRLWDLLDRPRSAVVDMETSLLVAALENVGLLSSTIVCRVVTDTAEEDLPAVIAHVRPNGSIAPTRLLAALVRRPSTIVSLARLGGRSREGSSRLAEAMGDWLRLD